MEWKQAISVNNLGMEGNKNEIAPIIDHIGTNACTWIQNPNVRRVVIYVMIGC